ncbi:MAG: Pathogenicity locus probable regulatory protein WtsA [Pseudomonadota bacterium]|jgi:DNA-binding NtrC family response regulator
MSIPKPGIGIFAIDAELTSRVMAAAQYIGIRCKKLSADDLEDAELEILPELVLLYAPHELIAGFAQRIAQGSQPLRLISASSSEHAADDCARLFISVLRGITPDQPDSTERSLPPLPPVEWSEEEEALFFSHDPEVLRTVITAQRVARVPVDIVIEGETGVGKDTLARKIHAISGRTGRYIGVNCAAVPENLVESEFFGVEPGAFTGAMKARPGKIEAAHHGTLYLDEIDSMPAWMQAKLLRALQERGCERLGSTRFIPSDFRTIASSRVPLERMVAAGHFRSDLYYRLNVVSLKLPALRNRPSDVPKLFQRFVRQACDVMKLPYPVMTAEVETALATYDWPGNLRELRAAASRFALHQSPVPLKTPLDNSVPLKERMRGIERALITSSLERHGGSVQNASQELKVPAYTLYYRMKALGIGLPKSGPPPRPDHTEGDDAAPVEDDAE